MEKTPEKEGYSIGEVADLLQVATSKLRHWEAMDLFSVEKQPNHYRCYDMADVVNIAEVLTYRELGFPISRIEEMRRADVADYEQLLHISRAELHKKLEEYRSILKRMDRQRAAVRDLKKLDAGWPRAEAVPFERVVKFDYSDAVNIRRYIHEPALYVRHAGSLHRDAGHCGRPGGAGADAVGRRHPARPAGLGHGGLSHPGKTGPGLCDRPARFAGNAACALAHRGAAGAVCVYRL